MSNKMMSFSYKGRCGIRERTHIEAFKTRAGLGYTVHKWLYVISNTMLFKTATYTTKNLRNKAILT